MRMRYFIFLFLCVAPSILFAQEFRGTISGSVLDPSGATVPGAQITAIQTETGVKTQTVTNAQGQYTLPFLLPGDYQIRAQAHGFKEFVRHGIHLAASAHPVVDIQLSVGVATETVQVTAGVPLVNTENASTGQTITTKQVEDLPLNGRNPMMLAQLAIGVLDTANPSQVHPFDNNGAAAWSIGGTPSQTSELLIDGSPDEMWSGSLAYSPPQDAVQEVKVDAFNTDAAYGHTFGGTGNLILKSGTNGFHGSMYEFGQPSNLDANNFFNNRSGVPLQVTHYNQYGLTAGGPVVIPKIYNGRDKLFWFFSWENLDDAQPTANFTTVPTDAERNGDFSALLALGTQYQIYNPYSGTLSGKTVNRQPFLCDSSGNPLPTNANGSQTATPGSAACNIIPQNLLNAVSLAYLKLYPEPNVTGAVDGENNFANANTSNDSFDNELGRLDFNMSQRSHLFFDFRHNNRLQTKNNYFGNIGTGTTLLRENWGGTVDEVYTFSPTLVADVRFNGTYMREVHGDPSVGFDPTQLGFPSYISSNSQYLILPSISFGSCGSQTSFQCLGSTGDSRVPSASYQIFGDVLKTTGNHAFKFGADVRQYRIDTITYGSSAGSYTFGPNPGAKSSAWTNGPTSSSAGAPFGQDFASFLLGLPTSGSYTVNSFGTFKSYYYAMFVQDDWRLKRNLTLNLGLRYEHETPYSESFGRTVNGFDFTSPSPVAAAAQTAFAAQYPSGLTTVNGQPPLTQFNVPGGLTFATPNNHGAYQVKSHLFSPRVGFAWSPSYWMFGSSTIRGGFGLFVSPLTVATLAPNGNYSSNPIINQEGFSATTQYLATSNNFLGPATTLIDPFPNGISQPVGSSLGLGTFLGQTVTFFNPEMKEPYSIRWNLGVQHSITPNLLLEVDYVGNHAVHLPIQNKQLNSVPAQYLSTATNSLDPAYLSLVSSITSNVANPLAGLLPGTNLNSSTIGLSQLLAPYPQFPQGTGSTSTGVIMQNYTEGTSSFNSLDVRLEKRLSFGLSIIGNYVFSKLIEADSYLNPTDPRPEVRISPFDYTHHFVVGFSYGLPIGRGRALNLESRWSNMLLGGWTVNGIYTRQSGAPIYWSNSDYVYLGGPLNYNARETQQTLVNGKLISVPAFNTSAFNTNSKQQFQYHIRTFPTTLSSVRYDGINNLDASILKSFRFSESMYLQLRFEAFNTFNHPTFGSVHGSDGPNMSPTSSSFGVIGGQSNLPRQIQLGARFVW